MPLTSPLGGGGGLGSITGALMAIFPIRNTGADTFINLQAAQWDNVNSRILIGGDNDYFGTKASVFSKMQQAATLPASNNSCRGVSVNRTSFTLGGALYLDTASALFRSTDATYVAWVTITPPTATLRRGAFTVTGDDNIYVTTDLLAAPARNIEVSADNGATWDSDPGLFAPLTNNAVWVRTNRAGTVVAMGTVDDFVSTTDPNDNSSWEFYSFVTAGSNQSVGAISDDGTQIVACSTIGGITTVDGLTAGNEFDIPVADNPFAQSAANGLLINFCEFIPSLNGFMLASVANELVGFISSDDMTVCQRGLYLGTGSVGTTSINGTGAVDLNGDAMMVSTANVGDVFLRFGT